MYKSIHFLFFHENRHFGVLSGLFYISSKKLFLSYVTGVNRSFLCKFVSIEYPYNPVEAMSIFKDRIEAVRAMMRSKGWDVVIVTGNDPHNSEYSAARWHQVAWLSGYTGESSVVPVWVKPF